ncbi:MAG: hypothetical protein KME54_02745 [Tolypothrix brevis GSE-NOS-MK-07-07A]|nr:hypothetical protein [Tolypothrix brevis GSE-NOS-MK-07-07A]
MVQNRLCGEMQRCEMNANQGRSRCGICNNRFADDTLPDKICSVPQML